jgi:predicted GTPase
MSVVIEKGAIRNEINGLDNDIYHVSNLDNEYEKYTHFYPVSITSENKKITNTETALVTKTINRGRPKKDLFI